MGNPTYYEIFKGKKIAKKLYAEAPKITKKKINAKKKPALDRALNKFLGGKPKKMIFNRKNQARVVIPKEESRSRFFKKEYEKEKNILSWD